MNTTLKKTFLLFGLLIGGLVVLGFIFLPDSFRELFNPNEFMPHKHCYLEKPEMVWLQVTSDLLIGLAYVSISGTLAYLVYKARRNIPFHWMFLAFGLFIISCGFTHFMEVVTVWQAYYWLAGYIKLITALVSVTTAVALFPLVPKIFALIDAVKISEERRVKLVAANEELERFASSIAHDLRAPLRTMQGMAVALKEDFGDSLAPSAHGYMDKIIGGSVRMDRLIQDLLAYSRMNLSELELARTDLKSVLNESLAMLAANIQERNAVITFTGTFPPVMADRSLLLQAGNNLLTNALKFTAPGVPPQITIQGEVTETSVRVSVCDNGIGIAPQHQERIFKVFERLHTNAEYPGTGIGLALVQRAVKRLGGTLGVESDVGKGSRFWFELPRA